MSQTVPPAAPAQRWAVRSVIALMGLTTVAVVGVMGRAFIAGAGDVALVERAPLTVFGLLVVVWNVAPVVGCAMVVVQARRHWPLGLGATVAVAPLVAAFTVWTLHDFLTSDSSTAALIFIFLPFYLWLAVGAGAGAAALLHTARERRTRRRTAPR